MWQHCAWKSESGTALSFSMDRIPQSPFSLTEVDRYVDTGWHMTGEERSKLKSGDLVILVADDRTSIKMKKQDLPTPVQEEGRT
jgi:hypothetical protein